MKLNYSGASDNALDMHSKVYTQMANPYAVDAHSLVYIVACNNCYPFIIVNYVVHIYNCRNGQNDVSYTSENRQTKHAFTKVYNPVPAMTTS